MTFTLRLATLVPFLLVAACGGPSAEPTGSAPHEETWAFPLSTLLLTRPDDHPNRVFVKAQEVAAELRAGRDFADVVRQYSQDEESKGLGGFLGFLRPRGEDRISGAMQALVPSRPSPPIEMRDGIRFFYRHTFDEGRRLEEATSVPAYGFSVPWREIDPESNRSREEAYAKAKELVRALEEGRVSMLDAALEYGHGRPKRDDGFLGRLRDVPGTKALYDRLRQVPEGAFAEPFDTPDGAAVMKRGKSLRAIVRHILIRHRDSPDRTLSVRRSREEAMELAEKVAAEASRDGSNWTELVRRYSDDARSVPLDGSLGIVGNGDAFAKLEEALLATEPGHVADTTVESPDGFHILFRVR